MALREPSMGPCMGMKGGATGGGYSQLVPADRINLHFTGDFHAVTSAHNLLAALLDNHIYFGNRLRIDPRRILWRRVMDMNDRALRNIIVGLGGAQQGVPRETGFDITAASEVMAMLCLASGVEDLRARIERTLVAFTYDGEPVTAGKLSAAGAMLALLRDALRPNLVQTLEGTPVLVHGGPFANIAHGCNSVLATRMALHLADWAITEAGFGFDLGAEKFFDIKCASAGLDTAAVVLVATVRALKMHGGVALARPRQAGPGCGGARPAQPGEAHREHPPLRRAAGGGAESLRRRHRRRDRGRAPPLRRARRPVRASPTITRAAAPVRVDLARAVMAHAEKQSRPFRPLYDWTQPVPDKILAVAQKMYGARAVVFTKAAERDLQDIRRLGLRAAAGLHRQDAELAVRRPAR